MKFILLTFLSQGYHGVLSSQWISAFSIFSLHSTELVKSVYAVQYIISLLMKLIFSVNVLCAIKILDTKL